MVGVKWGETVPCQATLSALDYLGKQKQTLMAYMSLNSFKCIKRAKTNSEIETIRGIETVCCANPEIVTVKGL